MSVPTEHHVSEPGLELALRRLSSSVVVPLGAVCFMALMVSTALQFHWEVGFDFRGTLWEPARSLLDGGPVYPEPVHSSIVIGNPAVYPPLFIVLTVPLALASSAAAAWIWLVFLAAAVAGALWILGVRDWRCYVVALTSPVVLQGVIWGNLTLFLLLPLAVAWRWRHRAVPCGLAVGTAIAAKVFVFPLLAWLLMTRRFRAAAIAAATAAALVLLPWAVIGFDGFTDYPKLLRELQEVYAVRSGSLASVFGGGIGVSAGTAVALATAVSVVLVAVACLLVRVEDGDRRAFALVIAACLLASPILWSNYGALLFVPVALTWPRLAPAWLFAYLCWLAEFLPKPAEVAPEPCCRPPGVTSQVWALSHSVPSPWYGAGMTAVILGVAGWCALTPRVAGRRLPELRRSPLHARGDSADEVAWRS